MQRLLFASAALVLGAFATEAAAVQDLPGYDLYRGAGAPSSFYAEGFAGYPGSYGAGMYVAGYGYAGNGYSGMGGPCCGSRVMQGPCNPWAGYTGHDPCAFQNACRRIGQCFAPKTCAAPEACCEQTDSCGAASCESEATCCDAKPCRKWHWKRLLGRKNCGSDCCTADIGCGGESGGCGDNGEMTVEGDAIDTIPTSPDAPAAPTPAPAPALET